MDLKQRGLADRERAANMEKLQAAAKVLAESLDAWLSTDGGRRMTLGELVASLGIKGAWVDRRADAGGFEVVATENIGFEEWRRIAEARYGRSERHGTGLAFSGGGEQGLAAVLSLGFQDEHIGHLGLLADDMVELSLEQNAVVETMAQNLSVSLLAQRLLSERHHRESIAASLAVITDLEHSGAEIGRHLRQLVPHDVMEIAVLGHTGKVDTVWRVDASGSVARPPPVFLEVPREPTEASLDAAFPLLQDTQARWVLVVPLSAGDRVEGAVVFGRESERYSPREMSAAVALAPLLSTAVARMRLEEQLKLSEQFSALGGFSRMLAHEVRNPLNSMSLHAQLLDRKLRKLPLHADQELALKDHLGLLKGDMQRLEDVVSDFVSLAAGDAAHSSEPLDLRGLVQEVMDVHAPSFDEREIQVHAELGEDPVVVRVHSERIQQILHNLIKNAIDALADARNRSLRIAIQRKDASVEVRVRDSGPGLADTNIVFSPNYSTKAGGGGMGLAISRQIARLHAGYLGAEKPESGGAEFVLSLPLAS